MKKKRAFDTLVIGELKHVQIAFALELISKKLCSDQKLAPTFAGLCETDARLKRDMAFARARNEFNAFCDRESVLPVGITDQSALIPYSGDSQQDSEYQISVEQFRRFASSYGIKTESFRSLADLGSDEFICQSDRVTSDLGKDRMTLVAALECPPLEGGAGAMRVATGDDADSRKESAGDWDDPDIERVLAAKHAKNQKKKAKNPPGMVPHTSVGKLAIQIAWSIQVDTGRAATTAEVMSRLRQIADSGDEPECLLRSVMDEANEPAVEWLTSKGAEKPYRLDACARLLSKWRQSVADKQRKRT